jgi:beta-lactamase regulating signal transducer with metallopeptidase domain
MSPIVNATTSALLQFVWQGAAVAIVLSVVLALLSERSANARYIACCLAMLALVVLPILTGLWSFTASGYAVTARSNAFAFTTLAPVSGNAVLAAIQLWAFPLWALGMALSSLRLFISWTHVARIRRSAGTVSAAMIDVLASVERRLGMHRRVSLALTEFADSPIVVGWWRPMILLPASAIVELTRDQLEAVLAHELAHVRRYDDVVNLAQVMVETVLFYHPATWWVSARVRRERERCCDDAAVALSGDPAPFVRALLTLEQTRSASPTLAIGLRGSENDLLPRVRRLLRVEPALQRAATVAVAIAGFVLLACVGSTLDAPRQETARHETARGVRTDRLPGASVGPENADAAIASTLASRVNEPVDGRQLVAIQIAGGTQQIPESMRLPIQLGDRVTASTRAQLEASLRSANAPLAVDVVALPGGQAAVVIGATARN